jgi:hypothetical protein
MMVELREALCVHRYHKDGYRDDNYYNLDYKDFDRVNFSSIFVVDRRSSS